MIAQESQSSIETSPEALIWKTWKPRHEEICRMDASMVIVNDKILIVAGSYYGKYSPRKDIILVNPKRQTLRIVKSHVDNEDSFGWHQTSVCYWKDNKIIVHGGKDCYGTETYSTVAIVTLTLSHEPSAYWEKVETQTQLPRNTHSTYVYNDKMYTFGGSDGSVKVQQMWCLDLTTFAWSQIEFEGWQNTPKDKDISIFHENKAYIAPKYLFSVDQDFIIQELDLDSRTCKEIKIPQTPTQDANSTFCHQLINGKFYICTGRDKHGELWFYDLKNTDSNKQWASVKMKQNPNFDRFGRVIWCNNLLVDLGWSDFYSLSLSNPSDKKTITQVQQTMKEFLTEAPYSDVSFEVDSQIIKAHKWFLCKKNKYFANMFSSGMSEAQASKITITDMKVSTFKSLLEFLYSEHVELNETSALELLQQADKYSILQLKKECEEYLTENLTPENYIAVCKIAETLKIGSLREAVVDFITKNHIELEKRNDFDQISETILYLVFENL